MMQPSELIYLLAGLMVMSLMVSLLSKIRHPFNLRPVIWTMAVAVCGGFAATVWWRYDLITELRGPTAFYDAFFYLKKAYAIYHYQQLFIDSEGVVEYPPLYSLLLAPMFGLGSMQQVLRGIFLVGLVTSVSAIVPLYLIARDYCTRLLSWLIAVVAVSMPVVFLRSLTVMSENLYLPLFAWFYWFLVRYLKTGRLVSLFFASTAAIFLFLTRVIGVAAVASVMLIVGVQAVRSWRNGNRAAALKALVVMAAPMVLGYAMIMLNKHLLELSSSGGGYGEDSASGYISAIAHLAQWQTLLMVVNEFNYLNMATGGVCLVLLAAALMNRHVLKSRASELITLAVTSVFSVAVVIPFMISKYWAGGGDTYLILGRYLDHLVPLLTVISLGLAATVPIKLSNGRKVTVLLAAAVAPVLILAIPFTRVTNMFNQAAIIGFNKMSEAQIVGLFLIAATAVAYWLIQGQQRTAVLFSIGWIVLISMSINNTVSAEQLKFNKGNYSLHTQRLMKWFDANALTNDDIVYDRDDFAVFNWRYYGLRTLLMDNYTLTLGDITPDHLPRDYVISSDVLDCPLLMNENDGLKLYDCNDYN